MKKLFLLFLTIFFLAIPSFAQSNFGNSVPGASIQTCEEFSSQVDIIRSVAKNSKKKVFAIFHAGKTESEIVNFRRLAYVRDYLRSDSKQWNELDVIYARGDKSSEKAVIVFYLDGEFFTAMGAPHNMTPCMDCCEARYYTPQNLSRPITLESVKAREKRKTYTFP